MNNYYYLFFVSGLLVAFAYDDLSYKKDASQSSTWVGGSSYLANNAVDGHSLTCMRTLDIGMNSLKKAVWWKVDLGDVYNIHSINIIFKNYNGIENKQRGRFAGFSLYVSNNDISSTNDIQRSMQCYMDGNELPPLNFSTTCTEYGRYVVFYNERLTGVKYPSGYELENVITELCEVTVHGCSRPNVYGFECDKQCPKNCKSNICHIQEGFCFACTSGWAGQYCNTTCTLGWYGQNCSKKCIGHCKDNSFCNHVTGMCDKGCDGGWTGELCNEECHYGTYGYNCVNNCSGHCRNDTPCNKQTGVCDKGCNPGYTGLDCKGKCFSGFFGINCREHCSGHCKNSEPCDPVSGMCPNGCQVGYNGTICIDSCTLGWYGQNCSKKCIGHCKDNSSCNHVTGMCDKGCDGGWTGKLCNDECGDGTYGYNCVNNCSSHCLNNTPCHKQTGNCERGCKQGYTNNDCKKKFLQSQKSTTWTVEFSISFAINIVFVSVMCSSFWIICARRIFHSRDHPSCFKSEYYTGTEVKTDEVSNYQELKFSREEIAYQNLTLK